jgi:DNA-binding CsgD family transcriptional regulator
VLSDALNIALAADELERQSRLIVETFLNFLNRPKRHSAAQLGVQLRYRKLTPASIFQVNKLMRRCCLTHLSGELVVVGLEAVADFFALVLQEYVQVCEALPVLRKERARQIEALSNEERMLLQMMAAGLTNQQMALRTGVTRRTIVNHLKTLRHKLATYSRTDTVLRAVELGLFNPDDGQSPIR